MKKYAVINGNKITNIVLAETALKPNWIDITGMSVQIGWSYVDDVFTPPSLPPITRVERYRFLFELFHPVEQVALDAARQNAIALTAAQIVDPNASAETLAYIVIRNAYERFSVLEFVDLDVPATNEFLQSCKGLGVFGPDLDIADLRIASIKNNENPPEL